MIFETNFDPNDRLSPRPLLEQIVRNGPWASCWTGSLQHWVVD